MNTHRILLSSTLALYLAMPLRAEAHTHDGVQYDPSCCNSAITSPTGDCAPIEDKYVTAEADGYHINLPVGAHPKLKKHGYVGIVPYAATRKPLDEKYHICLATDGANRFCFFAKPMGS